MDHIFNLLNIDAMFATEPLVDLQNALGAQWETLVHGIALLGDSRLILVMGIALFWFVGKHRPYQVLAASLLGAGLGSLLKVLIDLPRPADPDLLIYSTTTSPSFPSGHVVLATCFWGTLAWYGWIPRWTVAIVVALVMFARVYLGAHFIGDVVFGALIGFAWLLVFHRWVGPWLERVDPGRLSTVVAVIMAGSFLVLPITSAFPFGWEIVGGLVGAGVGIILQERRVRFNPGPVDWFWQIGKALIGAAGVLLIVLIDVLVGPEHMALELAIYFVAAVWGLLLAPMIFQSIGLGSKVAEPEAAA